MVKFHARKRNFFDKAGSNFIRETLYFISVTDTNNYDIFGVRSVTFLIMYNIIDNLISIYRLLFYNYHSPFRYISTNNFYLYISNFYTFSKFNTHL